MQDRFSLPGTQGFCVKTFAGVSSNTDLLVPKMYDQQVCMDQTITVNPEQLVMEVIEIMLQSEQYALPLYRNGSFEGIVQFKELIRFLVEDKDGHNLLFHKFNFTLETALIVMAMDNISNALEL